MTDELNDRLERIYEIYGNDLEAFFRDARAAGVEIPPTKDERIAELEAQLAEANTFKESVTRFITSDCGIDHSQISFPDFMAQGGNQCSLCLTVKLTAAEARLAEVCEIRDEIAEDREREYQRWKQAEARESRLREAIQNCLKRANGRQHEWGERAVAAFLYLEEALQAAATRPAESEGECDR